MSALRLARSMDTSLFHPSTPDANNHAAGGDFYTGHGDAMK